MSIRLKFTRSMVLTDAYVEEQKKEFQVGKRASKRARLLFTTSCRHPKIIFFARDVDFMDQIDPFVCDWKKEWSG